MLCSITKTHVLGFIMVVVEVVDVEMVEVEMVEVEEVEVIEVLEAQ